MYFLQLNIAQWGLIFDLIGVLLLFKYGLPSKIEDTGIHFLAGHVEGDKQKDILKKNNRIKIGANFGLTLVFIGFVLQFINYFFKY
jgi:hypothetical protein